MYLISPFRVFNPDDQHMLGQPSLLFAEIASDAQRLAFLSQQGIAAVIGPDAPNRVVFREMADITAFRIDVGFAVQAPRKVLAFGQFVQCHPCPFGS